MKNEDLDKLVGININEPPMEIKHRNLERYSEKSDFKSICPSCKVGLLLVTRDQKTLKLIPQDRCVLCGQAVIYTDIEELKKKVLEA